MLHNHHSYPLPELFPYSRLKLCISYGLLEESNQWKICIITQKDLLGLQDQNERIHSGSLHPKELEDPVWKLQKKKDRGCGTSPRYKAWELTWKLLVWVCAVLKGRRNWRSGDQCSKMITAKGVLAQEDWRSWEWQHFLLLILFIPPRPQAYWLMR